MLAAFGVLPMQQSKIWKYIPRNKEEEKSSAIRHDGLRLFHRKTGVLREAKVDFRFGKRTVPGASVRPDGIFDTEQQRWPYVAYVNFETVSRQRDQYVFGAQNVEGRANVVILARGKKKLQAMEPATAWEDPYIAGILVALAQEQREQQRHAGRRADGADADVDGSQTVYAIGVPGGTAVELYLYAAVIPAEFLDKFEMPSEASECGGVVIRYYTVNLTEEKTAADLIRRVLCGNALYK
ncbi:hypothetical protein QQS21_008687 [Conoideocrella luteorostrata]|uniref:Uncharacterized protein n=1 Tax=Conoideocrella luteorostrata TaxID=1105319 RepID=A0AAJ0CL21_9HYPO|nr:hypothetical protein QQS21_008687 [Conoideocrella luteorostrata]